MAQLLSAGERDRAGRFYFEKDRKHYIMARGQLRVILSRYLDTNPDQLRFRSNPYGKPGLTGLSGMEWLTFNVSHSGGLALYAVAHSRRVGIDLERIREDVSCDLLARRFFSARENDALHALPPEAKTKAFFDCWTRKEAYIKGRGEGLSIPLEQFDVSLGPGEPAKLLGNRLHPDDVSRWSLQEITLAPGYAAAVAVEGRDWRITCFDATGLKAV
jgi:4'-phosphopantetheinyl transferase